MAAMVASSGGAPKTGTSHPTVGVLHELTATDFLVNKLRPVTTGPLLVSVRLVTGQVSTLGIPSTSTVADLKAAVVDECGGGEGLPLMYLGKVLVDSSTLEACLVADRSTLVQVPRARSAAGPRDAFVAAAVNDVQAKIQAFGSHQAALSDRVKHRPAEGLDVLDAPSWHDSYTPYATYVPPTADGTPAIQAPAYEKGGAQAWRADYKINGPGAHAQINNEYAFLNAPEETE